MCHPRLKHTAIAASLSLLVTSLLLSGTTPASSQSKPTTAQGIPQQVAALEQRVAALDQQLGALGQRLSVLDERLSVLDQRLGALGSSPGTAKGLRVVDANGREVGPMISRSEVIRKLGDLWLVFTVGPSGFAETVPLFYNSSADCRGTRYMGDSPDLIRQAYVVGGIAYYGDGNPESHLVAAYEYVFPGDSSCTPMGPVELSLSRVASRVLSTDPFAFVPPFTVQYDQ
jgi:hypothetical protein